MTLAEERCVDFLDKLASKAAVPGGGGACALVGALGIALGQMVGNLTIGKEKYAVFEADLRRLNERAQALQTTLANLIQADADAFTPLSLAYGLPAGTREERAHKAKVMQEALDTACQVPLAVMHAAGLALDLLRDYARMGARTVLSDAGVGAVCCRAALEGAALNVRVNAKAMTDRIRAEELEEQAEQMLARTCPLADQIYQLVSNQM